MELPRVYECRSLDGQWSFEIPEGGAVVIGRNPELADVVIPWGPVARLDTCFRNEGGVLTVEPMRRRSSLWLNGEVLSEPVSRPLVPGDEVKLLHFLVFVVGSADACVRLTASEFSGGEPPPTAVTLEYTGHTLIRFDDPTDRWISVKRFAWDGSGNDSDVLAALIAHWRYRDHYAAPDSHEQDAGDIHGPYRLGAITPAAFAPIGPDASAALVREFCSSYGCQPEVREKVAATVLPLFGGSSCRWLRNQPGAVHEWGFVFREFRELVVIAREAGEVVLVVMAVV